MLSIIHESRMQTLAQWGFDELNAGGTSLIMADVAIAYKGEAFYGDKLIVNIYVQELTERSFDLLYHISTQRGDEVKDIAHAKTGMLCFNYRERKIDMLTEALKRCLSGG